MAMRVSITSKTIYDIWFADKNIDNKYIIIYSDLIYKQKNSSIIYLEKCTSYYYNLLANVHLKTWYDPFY